MGHGLRLALLGNVEIRRDGVSVTGFTSLKALALLCYLAVTGRPHLRPTLAGLLWGELPEERAVANLRKALTNLRQLVGPYVRITRHEVAFDPDSVHWLDVKAFEAGVVGGSHNADSPHDVTGRIARAVELYRGDFLEGFYVREAPAFEDWALAQRARLRELALQGLHALIVYHARRGTDGHALAVSYATRLLALEPWREEAHRELMVLLARSGQRGAALAQYETCRQVLASDLGVEPGVQTKLLYEHIRDGNLTRPPGPDEPPTSQARPGHNLPAQPIPLVGREREISEVGECLVDPDCRLLTLVGPGGSGKTRLAIEAALGALETFEHGACFVPLVAVDADEELAPTLAHALGLSLAERGDPGRQLLDHLSRRRMLLMPR